MKFRLYIKQPIITMNGTELPYFARSLSNAAVHLEVPEVVGNWWFSFDCCHGREMKASSEKTREMCRILREAILSNSKSAQLAALKAFFFRPYDPAKVVPGWLEALDCIRSLTENCSEVVWFAKIDPDNFQEIELPDMDYRKCTVTLPQKQHPN